MAGSTGVRLTHRLMIRTASGAASLALRPIAKLEIQECDINPDIRRGLIIAANHRSLLDFFVGLVAFGRWHVYPYFFVRSDICKIPVLGLLLRTLGAIPAGGKEFAGRRAQALLQAGQVLVITPEGHITRAADRIEGIATLRPGVGHLAARLGTPILLVGVVNTDICWELGTRFPKIRLSRRRRPTVRLAVEFLEIEAGRPGRAITAQLQSRLSQIVSSLDGTI